MAIRSIVRIDQELCDGCGLCVAPCAEGAIEIVKGKAQVMRDELCDGAGFCIGICPTGALTLGTREAAPFDALAAETSAQEKPSSHVSLKCFRCGVTEEDAVLLPCRTKGQSLWVCTRCLPALIHR